MATASADDLFGCPETGGRALTTAARGRDTPLAERVGALMDGVMGAVLGGRLAVTLAGVLNLPDSVLEI